MSPFKTARSTATVAGLFSILLALPAAAQSGNNSWTISSRELAPPVHASPELAASIANSPQPDVRSNGSQFPATDAEWIAMQAAASSANPLPALAASMNLQFETIDMAGVTVYTVTPERIARQHRGHVFLHLHGGGYVLGGGPGAAAEAAQIAAAAGIYTVSVDYRMPPAHPFPAAIDDAIAVYKELLEDYDADEIAIGGTSAGAGLSFATVLEAKNQNLPVPAAIFAGTPWADLTDTSDSLHVNEGIDRILVSYPGLLKIGADLYANGQELLNPLLSPLYGDFSGFPPTILISGTRDMLLSDTARAQRKLLDAGVEAELHVLEGMSHAEYMIQPGSPEGKAVYLSVAAFLQKHMD